MIRLFFSHRNFSLQEEFDLRKGFKKNGFVIHSISNKQFDNFSNSGFVGNIFYLDVPSDRNYKKVLDYIKLNYNDSITLLLIFYQGFYLSPSLYNYYNGLIHVTNPYMLLSYLKPVLVLSRLLVYHLKLFILYRNFSYVLFMQANNHSIFC